MRVSRILLLSLCAALGTVALSLPTAAAAQVSPAFAKAQSKGQALMEKGKYEAAIKQLKKAEQRAGESPAQLLLDLAVCHNNVGDFSDAEAYARRALATADPMVQGRAYNHLGISLHSQALVYTRALRASKHDRPKDLEEAESAFRKVLEITGGQATVAWYNLGEVLKFRGKRKEADAAFAEYLARSPEGARAVEARRAMAWLACVQSFSEPKSSAGPAAPMTVGGEVQKPVKINTPQPSYNERARSAGIQGTMAFEAIIDKNGDVRCLDVVKGLPMGMSEDAAKVISQWKFEPATLHGEPVVVNYNVIISMSIDRRFR